MAFDPVTLGAAVQLAKDPATIKASVEDWLDDHPEATTTVEDGSITKTKLHDDLAGEIDDNTAAVAALEDDVGELKSAFGINADGNKDVEFEAGSFAYFNAGQAITDLDGPVILTTRKRTPATELLYNLKIKAFGDYSFNLLKVNINDIILSASGWQTEYTITEPSLYRVVLRNGNGSDVFPDSVSIDDVITFVPIDATQKEIAENIDSIKSDVVNGKIKKFMCFEPGSYTYLTPGQNLEKNDTSTYLTNRKRTNQVVSLKNPTIIVPDGYLANVVSVSAGKILWVSGWAGSQSVESGDYAILVKASDESNISAIDANSIISVYEPVNSEVYDDVVLLKEQNKYASIVWEHGSLLTLNVGQTAEKLTALPYTNTRWRTSEAVTLEKNTRITTVGSIRANIVEVNANDVIVFTSGYLSSYEIRNDGKFWIIVKDTNDNNVYDIDTKSCVSVVKNYVSDTVNLLRGGKNYRNTTLTIPEVYEPITVEAIDGSETFNNENVSVDLIYGLYDDLMEANPTYITKEDLGLDQSGTYHIYAYYFTPESIVTQSNTVKAIPFPKLIIKGGAHGDGTNAGDKNNMVFALYFFFKDLCEEWRNDKAIEFMRWNIKFAVIPLQNPWGFENKSRQNSRNIDFIHNFNHQHDPTVPSTANNYGGATPESEAETKIVKKFIDDNSDAVFDCDIHTTGGNQLQNRLMYFDMMGSSQAYYVARGMITQLSHIWDARNIGTLQPMNFHGYVEDRAEINAKGMYYAELLNIPTCIFEGFPNFENSGLTSHCKDIMVMCAEEIGNFVLNVIRFVQNTEPIVKE